MIISTIPASNCTPQTIVIGRRGTYDTMQIAFDLSYLVGNYGSGTAVLAIKRSQDESAYPAVVIQEDNTLTWTITETDTYYVGSGECQLMWYVDGGLAKSIIYPMVVMRDILSTAEEPPDGYENWVESLTALGAETQQHALDAAQSATEAETAQGKAEDAQSAAETAQGAAEEAARKAEEASAHAPIIVNGYWYSWDAETETYQNTGVKAEGRDGTDGVSPVITVTDITGGHRVTITDADGTKTVDVMNGTDGTDGDDGYSPVVTVTNITGGHRVTITDKTHPTGQSFDVMDGQDGASDAGEVTYDETATYPSGSVGAELSNQKNAIGQLEETVLPETVEATEALTYYPLNAPNGSTVQIKSKTGQAYSSSWAILFYESDKTTVLQYQDISADQTEIRIPITASGIIYARSNVSFSGDALISVLLGDSLIEKVEVNSDNIASNTSAIAENTKEITDIKNGKNNLYDGITLILGRVYQGVYSDAITTVHCTDFLPITPGRTYAVYGAFLDQNYSNYYDKNKVYKGSLPLEGLNNQYPYTNSYNFLLFTAPSDAAYTRINFFNSDLIDGTDIRPEWYFRDVTNLVWAKKKILVIGDSISTDVYGNYKKWVTDLQDEGFISNGLVNNNSQHATGFVATYSGDANTTFINRLTAVGDLTGLDIVITFGGINDWIQSVDFDAFKTAVDAYFAYLIEHATQARIIVFSPLHTALYGTTNSAGKTQKDYDDYIKSVAKDYAFPCLNLTDESGFCPDKSATFSDMWTLLPAGFSDHDGVHPIETWEKNFLAPMIKGFLSSM